MWQVRWHMANAAMLSPAHVVPCTTVERRLSLVATVYSFEALKFLNLVPRYNDFEVRESCASPPAADSVGAAEPATFRTTVAGLGRARPAGRDDIECGGLKSDGAPYLDRSCNSHRGEHSCATAVHRFLQPCVASSSGLPSCCLECHVYV